MHSQVDAAIVYLFFVHFQSEFMGREFIPGQLLGNLEIYVLEIRFSCFNALFFEVSYFRCSILHLAYEDARTGAGDFYLEKSHRSVRGNLINLCSGITTTEKW